VHHKALSVDGAPSRPRWRSLQRSPRSPSCISEGQSSFAG